MVRVLFILKQRNAYEGSCWSAREKEEVKRNPNKVLSSGLLNSASFIVEMLVREGVDAKLVGVIDNNGIDREVARFRPHVAIIEALWVVPEKFTVLQKLHPTVQWVIRGHSEVPFLAQEGIAIDWLTRCVQHRNVAIAANSKSSLRDLRTIIQEANRSWGYHRVEGKVLYLPNYFPADFPHVQAKMPDEFLDIACFGAIRPLKNQLIQAVAAHDLASLFHKKLRFHINSSRIELAGENVLKNLRALFAATGQQLMEHDWVDRPELLQLLQRCDGGMQVSFTESFNIIAADMTSVRLPMVVSPGISWASHLAMANPNDSRDIVRVLARALDPCFGQIIHYLNGRGLRHHSRQAQEAWLKYLGRVDIVNHLREELGKRP